MLLVCFGLFVYRFYLTGARSCFFLDRSLLPAFVPCMLSTIIMTQ